jgi:hypothetical protein
MTYGPTRNRAFETVPDPATSVIAATACRSNSAVPRPGLTAFNPYFREHQLSEANLKLRRVGGGLIFDNRYTIRAGAVDRRPDRSRGSSFDLSIGAAPLDAAPPTCGNRGGDAPLGGGSSRGGGFTFVPTVTTETPRCFCKRATTS